MLDEVTFVNDLFSAEIALCVGKANECANAIVKLPATAASGESVLAGANNEMDRLVNYWIARLRAAGTLVSVDDFRAVMKGYAPHPIVSRKLGMI